MAKAKSVLGKLVTNVISKTLSGGKKVTRSRRSKGPSVRVNKTPQRPDVSPQKDIWGTNPTQRQIYTTNTDDFRRKVKESISRTIIYARWHKLGQMTADQLTRDKLIDVRSESDDIQTNFEKIDDRFNLLSNYLIKTDYRFVDFGKAVEKNFINMADVLTKNQLQTMNVVNNQLNKFDTTLSKISNKMEVYDRQIDELYGRVKNDNKKGLFSSFLDKKKSYEKNSAQSAQQNQEDKDGPSTLGMLGNAAMLGAAGGAAATGAAGLLKKAVKAPFKAAEKVGTKALGSVGVKLGTRLGARVAAGATGIGLGVVAGMTAYDFYQGYKKDGVWGGFKNAATLGMAYDGDEKPEDTQDLKSKLNETLKPIWLESSDNITLISKKTIKLETSAEIVLKAMKINLDGREILVNGKPLGEVTPGSQRPKTEEEKTWWDKVKEKFQGTNSTVGSPYMGRGSTGNRQRMMEQLRNTPGFMQRNGRGYSPMPGGSSTYQEALSPSFQPKTRNKTIGETLLEKMGDGKGFNREKFRKELENNPELRDRMLTLAAAEEGWKDPRAQREVLETMFNRADAYGKTLDDITKMKPKEYNYYQPYYDGAYNRNAAILAANPQLREELNKRLEEVFQGSNESNFGTHNASAGVAANSRITQTLTASGHGDDKFRKDNPAYTHVHGPWIIKKESEWYDKMKKNVENSKNSGVLPGFRKGVEQMGRGLDKVFNFQEKAKGLRLRGKSFIEGYDPSKRYAGRSNVSADYVNENFLPGMNFLGGLGMGGAIGENPYIRQGKFFENQNAGVDQGVHSRGGHHYGGRGFLASDISGGNALRPALVKAAGGEENSRALINALGDLMFNPEIVARVQPRELINQGRTINASGRSQGGGHWSHVHWAPGKKTNDADYKKLLSELMTDPDKFGVEGKRFKDLALSTGIWVKNPAGGFKLNPERYGNTPSMVAETKPEQPKPKPMAQRGITTHAGSEKPQPPKVAEVAPQQGNITGRSLKFVDQKKSGMRQKLRNMQATLNKIDEKKSAKNVAMNGSISGGKNTPSQKKEADTKTADAKPAVKNPSDKSIVTRNNRADSIPAGPADDGYGDFNPCLV